MMSIFEKKKKLVAGILILAMMFGTVSQGVLADSNSSVSDEKYPYTIFAASEEDGALSAETSNMCINGNVAVNGTVSVTGNININGTLTENAGLKMIFIFDKIETKYFSEGKMLQYEDDYTADENNINISVPTDVLGEVSLTGNINITTALKALDDIELYGEVKNTNNSVIFSKYGNIYIDGNNANLNGLIYAPFGDVYIESQNLNLNNVIVIAQSVTIVSPNINANYSTSMAEFVGNESELLYIPYDEWEYMGDENENGIPDFFEDMDNWSILLDTDGDNLPDSIEEYLGTDSTLLDTDEDGLTDYYELYFTYTSPLLYDTYENGISDGDEDFDEDGLTCIMEYISKTMPYVEDTDDDGLVDGEEVNTYMTNPRNVDTDEDGLEDGDEILFDCDPLDVDTDKNGIYDGEEKRLQTFLYDNKDGVVKNVSVTFEAKGNIQKTTTIENIMNIDTLCTDVVGLVGEPFKIETTSEFDMAILTFTIDMEQLENTEFNNLMFLWYDEENNEFIELETMLDEENSTISVETEHFSKYMIVDSEEWFDAWSIEFNYRSSDNQGDINITYDTVFAIDCSGSMSSYDSTGLGSKRAQAVFSFLDIMYDGDRAGIVTFSSSSTVTCALTDSHTDLINGLTGIKSSGGTSFDVAINKAIALFDEDDTSTVNKRIILLSDGEASVPYTALDKCNARNIVVYTIGLGSSSDSILQKIADYTGGAFYKAYTADELINIYSEIAATNDFDTTDTDGDGLYDVVERAGIRLQNGDITYDCDPDNPDTDGDGILDGEEIDFTPCRHAYLVYDDGCVYSKAGYYFVKKSDPISIDSDGDLDDDSVDPHPCNYQLNDCFIDKISDLEELAYSYNNNELDWLMKYNIDKKYWLSFMFIRQFANGENDESNYVSSPKWSVAGGEIDDEFVNYVYTCDPELYDYFENKNYIYANSSGELVDVKHLAATATVYIYESDLLDSVYFDYESYNEWYCLKKNLDIALQNGMKVASTELFEYHFDNLGGWAGDLQTLMVDNYVYSDYDSFYEAMYNSIGDENKSFKNEDLYADVDAYNIIALIDSKTSLEAAFSNYYDMGYKNRFTSFTNGWNRNRISDLVYIYTKNNYMFVIHWPLFEDEEKGVIYNFSEDQSKAARDAFVDFLMEKIDDE